MGEGLCRDSGSHSDLIASSISPERMDGVRNLCGACKIFAFSILPRMCVRRLRVVSPAVLVLGLVLIYFPFNFQFFLSAFLMALDAIKMPRQQFLLPAARKLLKIIFYDCHKDGYTSVPQPHHQSPLHHFWRLAQSTPCQNNDASSRFPALLAAASEFLIKNSFSSPQRCCSVAKIFW